jgi:hypothetical protein
VPALKVLIGRRVFDATDKNCCARFKETTMKKLFRIFQFIPKSLCFFLILTFVSNFISLNNAIGDSIREIEPNNSIQQANQNLTYGNTLTGNLYDRYDVDTYKFYAAKNGTVTFKIKPENAIMQNLKIRSLIKNSNGEILNIELIYANDLAFINLSASVIGGNNYYLVIDGHAGAIFIDDYEIIVQFNSDPILFAQSELEPNNTYQQANQKLMAGTELKGNLYSSYDTDIFAIEMEKGLNTFLFKRIFAGNGTNSFKVLIRDLGKNILNSVIVKYDATDFVPIEVNIGYKGQYYFIIQNQGGGLPVSTGDYIITLSNNGIPNNISNYEGVYSGTYDGVDRGTWVLKCQANGCCQGGYRSELHEISEYFTGNISSSGVVSIDWTNGDYIYLEIESNGNVSGTTGNNGIVYTTIHGTRNSPADMAKFSGVYEGSFSGDDSGTWRMVIDSIGYCTGSYNSKNYGVVGVGIGVIDASGVLLAVNDSFTVLYGTIDPNQFDVDADWYNYDLGIDGTLSGDLIQHYKPVINTPAGLTAKATSSTQIVLGWSDKSNNESGFKIERKNGSCSSSNTWTQIGTKPSNTNTYTVSGLSPNTLYSFRMKAYNTGGDSPYSNCASAKTGFSGVPAAPTNLKAASASSSKVNLSWKDNSVETGFKIYRKAGSASWAVIASTSHNVTKFTDATAINNNASVSYQYYVCSYNEIGNSPPTNTAIVTFSPTKLTATPGTTTGRINVSWTDKSSNETGFEIYRKTGDCSSANPWALFAKVGPNIKTLTNTGLTSGNNYSYKIRAYKTSESILPAHGYSLWSKCISSTAL